MTKRSAYTLKRRHDAQAFRLAWDGALNFAVGRLADSALSRAINGVEVPIYFKGEQIGERRHFDERLTMFLLRYRDPAHYGKWQDRVEVRERPEGRFRLLSYRISRMLRAARLMYQAAMEGKAPPTPEREILTDEQSWAEPERD